MRNELPEIVSALQAGDANRLDSVQDDELLLQAVAECERLHPEGLSEQAARGLDLAYSMRLLELAGQGSHEDEAHAFAQHLYRMAHDQRREHLDSMRPRFHARWRAYADVAALLMRLRAHERQNELVRGTSEKWTFVVDTLLKSGPDGLGWSALLDAICQSPIGPLSKGGLTHLLSRMRAAGWVRTVKTGRTVRVFLGLKAPASQNTPRNLSTVADVAQPAAHSALSPAISGADSKGTPQSPSDEIIQFRRRNRPCSQFVCPPAKAA